MTSVLAGRAVGAAGPKGEAIAQAALRLFLRDGYERTSVDAIAAEAGVSKRTIYNRYGDKENLFRSVLQDTYDSMMATFREIAETFVANSAAIQVASDRDLDDAILGLVRDPVHRAGLGAAARALVRVSIRARMSSPSAARPFPAHQAASA